MPFKLFTSNHLEILSEELAQTLSDPLSSSFQPEIIVVQSRGMERWVSLELAKKLGICANIRFPFPNRFVTELAGGLFSNESLEENSVFEPRFLTWEIMRLLPKLLDRPSFSTVKKYLTGTESYLKRLQLSNRIADLYDQYLLYRPEMIFEWEKRGAPHDGPIDTRWQAELWLEIIRDKGKEHRAAVGRRLIKALNRKNPGNLPERVTVFGISALPQFHVQVLAALANHTQVNLFLMNPCREYWGDIRSEREVRHIQKKISRESASKDQLLLFGDDEIPESEPTMDSLHYEQGNRLLAAMGKLGRDFFDLLESEVDSDSIERFVEPEDKTLLTSLQSDVLNLRDHSATDEKKNFELSDRSIQIHSCHSERREIEVLHDHLLDLFERDANLKPGDIIIMAPDIEKYTPYVQAVFDFPVNDNRRIPFGIADRSYHRENEVIDTFLAILDLYNSRLTATEVLNIFETTAIRLRFGLSEDDLQQIQYWVRETRIRWGADADHREKLGLPDFEQNTWRAGLDRLLLGYALPAEEKCLYENQVVPYDHIEGGEARVLSGLVEFTDLLFETVKGLNQARRLSEWSEFLIGCLEALFAAEGEALRGIYVIRRALLELNEFEEATGFDEKIDIRTVVHHLKEQLYYKGYGYGFLTGGVTFCSMLPMRSIPFKVICLIGMNNDAYPRADRKLSFDLIRKSPLRLGDRSHRRDDQYLFLETMLSAREVFYISYVGQNIKDNSIIPPSVLVSELIDYIGSNYSFKEEEIEIEKHIVSKHRLQAFSTAYFNGESEKLFSYSQENLEAARSFSGSRAAISPFIDSKVTEPDESFRTISLDDLYRFFRNPAQFFVRQRLKIFLRDDPKSLDNKEPFELRELDRYKVAEKLLECRMADGDISKVKQIFYAKGMLPHGTIGKNEMDSLDNHVARFTENLKRVFGAPLDPISIELEVNDFKVIGELNGINENGLVIYRYGRVGAKDHLRAWLSHLVLNCLPKNDVPKTTLAGIDSLQKGNWQGWTFQQVHESRQILTNILKAYWYGLQKPLHFFPETAFAYAEKKSEGEAERAAFTQLLGGDQRRGEIDDPYFDLCFRHVENPLDYEFKRVVDVIVRPILQYREKMT